MPPSTPVPEPDDVEQSSADLIVEISRLKRKINDLEDSAAQGSNKRPLFEDIQVLVQEYNRGAEDEINVDESETQLQIYLLIFTAPSLADHAVDEPDDEETISGSPAKSLASSKATKSTVAQKIGLKSVTPHHGNPNIMAWTTNCFTILL
ncbi:hypothetical protein H0H81_011455 [Sphagnurus paluster]|uniref:Uncharacterized protein n=1 Tax=Sphagnurus paluster TaxID=117069 RepID=A0A9P7GNQ8_9AGAR|nr:hypothetical protein H0H81_011455 [Sphagnurus paluster]